MHSPDFDLDGLGRRLDNSGCQTFQTWHRLNAKRDTEPFVAYRRIYERGSGNGARGPRYV